MEREPAPPSARAALERIYEQERRRPRFRRRLRAMRRQDLEIRLGRLLRDAVRAFGLGGSFRL